MYAYRIRFAGFFGTKAPEARRQFRRYLIRYLQVILEHEGIDPSRETQIEDRWDHLLVRSARPLEKILRRVPGIAGFSRVKVMVPSEDAQDTLREMFRFFQPYVWMRRFGVRADISRNSLPASWKWSSRKIERELGAMLMPYSWRVDLTSPEVWCYVEARKGHIYLYTRDEQGMGGVVPGMQGRVLFLISGGIDSPVGAWLLHKRGLDLEFLYFDLGSVRQMRALFRVLQFLRDHWYMGLRSHLIIIPFAGVVGEILQRRPAYRNLLLKVYFYRTAELIVREERLDAFATGESLGQVSTQTLRNLQLLERVVARPVLRPLLTMEKNEIIRIARQIGTWDLSYRGEEYCALTREGVVVRASWIGLMRQVIRCSERPLLEAMETRIRIPLNQMETHPFVQKVLSTNARGMSQEFPEIPTDARIIDLRSPEEFAQFHLPGSENIPFMQAWAEFPHWDRNQAYFLVCGEGMMSALLAHHMREAGFSRVSHLEGGLREWMRRHQIRPGSEVSSE